MWSEGRGRGWAAQLAAGACVAMWGSTAVAHTTAGLPPPPEPEDAVPRLRGPELQAEIPDLTVSSVPQRLRFTVLLAPVNFPFQFTSAGAEVAVYPVPWLHLRGTYLFGVSPTPDGVRISQYADVFLGLRVLNVSGERAVDIPVKLRKPEAPGQLAWIPRSHGLYVEGGFITGFLSLYRCVTNCSPRVDATYVPAPTQYVLPAFGLRYLQFSSYESKRRNARQVFAPSAFVQIVLPAINAPEYTLYNLTYNERPVPPIGVRIGAETPIGLFGPCLASLAGLPCVQGRVSLGLAPIALPVFFETALEFPFYVM
jgi:hypothetical protein